MTISEGERVKIVRLVANMLMNYIQRYINNQHTVWNLSKYKRADNARRKLNMIIGAANKRNITHFREIECV